MANLDTLKSEDNGAHKLPFLAHSTPSASRVCLLRAASGRSTLLIMWPKSVCHYTPAHQCGMAPCTKSLSLEHNMADTSFISVSTDYFVTNQSQQSELRLFQ
ncbi:UNVERIFIED_ORG: hypothetical protein M2402_003180 [Rahnella aquatilis]